MDKQRIKEFLQLKSKKELTAFAKENGHKLKSKSKSTQSMKKELFELLAPTFTLDFKTVEILLEPHQMINDEMRYIGSDGFLYDCNGNILTKV